MDARRSSPQEMPWGWREWVYVAVLVGGMVAFLALYGPRLREESASFPWFAAMLVLLLALSDLTGYAVRRSFGARPKPGLKWSVAPIPSFASLWTAEDHKFTALQYAAIGLVPVLVTLAAGSTYVAVAPIGTGGYYLLVVYTLTSAKNLWLALIALRQPEGTLFEERATGGRLFRPLPNRT